MNKELIRALLYEVQNEKRTDMIRLFRSQNDENINKNLDEVLEEMKSDSEIEFKNFIANDDEYLKNNLIEFSDSFYVPVKDFLKENRVKASQQMRSINTTTNNVISALEKYKKGLVFGQVQSGKTTHFTLLISKALSLNYDYIIVLSGVTNELRQQTQKRLEFDIVGEDYEHKKYSGSINFARNKTHISFFTGQEDIIKASKKSDYTLLDGHKGIFVIKKRPKSLEKIQTIFDQISGKRILVVDDEADNASLNIANNKEELEEASSCNKFIRTLLLSKQNDVRYIAYTATPFANIMINKQIENSILPDFLQYLTPNFEYQGYQRFFPTFDRKPDATIITFESIGVKKDTKFNAELFYKPIYLYVADIIKRNLINSSMVINITHYFDKHKELKEEILNAISVIKSQCIKFNLKDSNYLSLRDEAIEQLGMKKDLFSLKSFDEKFAKIIERLSSRKSNSVCIVNKNGLIDDIDYTEHNIIIGGYKLSRGITIENLSFFMLDRTSKDYDVILQQARFFGYRKEKIPTLYISEDNFQKFNQVSFAYNDLIDQITMFKIGDYQGAGESVIESIFIDKIEKYNITSRAKAGKINLVNRMGEGVIGNNFPFTSSLISAIDKNKKTIKKFISNSIELDVNERDRYGNGKIFSASKENFINFLREIDVPNLDREFVENLDLRMTERAITSGVIFIPQGRGEIEGKNLKNDIDGQLYRRGKKTIVRGKYCSSAETIKRTDYLGDLNRSDFTTQRSSNDFLIAFTQEMPNGEIDPIYFGIEIGGGINGAPKGSKRLSVKTSLSTQNII